MKCHQCDLTDDDARLQRCRICHQYFCEDHGYDWRGTSFCKKACSDFFFFADPEEEDRDRDEE